MVSGDLIKSHAENIPVELQQVAYCVMYREKVAKNGIFGTLGCEESIHASSPIICPGSISISPLEGSTIGIQGETQSNMWRK
jgi:hypothetical protein